MIKHYRSHGFECFAIFPEFWFNPPRGGATRNRFDQPLTLLSEDDYELINRLRREELVYASPAGDHDDFFHISEAFPNDGYVVTNDKFRDHDTRRTIVGHLLEKQAKFRDWRKKRLITATFIKDKFHAGENCPIHHGIGSDGKRISK